MKDINEIIDEGVFDLSAEKITNDSKEFLKFKSLFDLVQNDTSHPDCDALGNKLNVGDYIIVFPTLRGNSKTNPDVGRVLKVSSKIFYAQFLRYDGKDIINDRCFCSHNWCIKIDNIDDVLKRV